MRSFRAEFNTKVPSTYTDIPTYKRKHDSWCTSWTSRCTGNNLILPPPHHDCHGQDILMRTAAGCSMYRFGFFSWHRTTKAQTWGWGSFDRFRAIVDCIWPVVVSKNKSPSYCLKIVMSKALLSNSQNLRFMRWHLEYLVWLSWVRFLAG